MITIEQPALGFNSRHNHHIHVHMWNTGDVPATKSALEIVEWIRIIAVGAPGGRLKNVVFSCHGAPAQVLIGQGIGRADVPLFARLVRRGRPLVDKIWFRCCQVAYITPSPGGGVAAHADGNLFCSSVARTAQCYVVASTELQTGTVGRELPFGKIDTFEGLVLSYPPSGGSPDWSHRYPSTWPLAGGSWHQNPD